MSGMSTRSILFLVIFLVLVFVSEQAPPKTSDRDGSGEPPLDLFGKDKILRKPIRGPVLTDDNFDENSFDRADSNRRIPPPDYEHLSPEENDCNGPDCNDFSKPEKRPEISRDFDRDERPFEEPDIEDKDDELPRKVDEEIEIEKPRNEDYDEPQEGEIDHSVEEKDPRIPIDDDEEEEEEKRIKDVDESGDDNHDVADVPLDDDDEDRDSEKVPDDYPGAGDFKGGIFFDTPFFNVRQVAKYFQQLEKAMEHVFRQTLDEATLLNGTYANTTEEEVDIGGKKYVVQKSIIKGKDKNSSIYVEALSTVPKTNETKDAKDNAL